MNLRQIPITYQDRVYEAYAYEILGCMIVEEEVKRKLPNALRYFEKSLEVSTANNFDHGIVRAKGLIRMVNSKLSGQVNDDSLKSHKLMYEQRLKWSGESHNDTIKSGMHYAKELKCNHFGVKAERLFIELYGISARYHGLDHEVTEDVSSKRAHYMATKLEDLSLLGLFRLKIITMIMLCSINFGSTMMKALKDVSSRGLFFTVAVPYQAMRYLFPVMK